MATNKYCLKCFEYNRLDCSGVSDKNKEPKCYLFINNIINKYSEQWDKLPELNRNILLSTKVMNKNVNWLFRVKLLDWHGRGITLRDLKGEWYQQQRRGKWEYSGTWYTRNISSAKQIQNKIIKDYGYSLNIYCYDLSKYRIEILATQSEGFGFNIDAKTEEEAICKVGYILIKMIKDRERGLI